MSARSDIVTRGRTATFRCRDLKELLSYWTSPTLKDVPRGSQDMDNCGLSYQTSVTEALRKTGGGEGKAESDEMIKRETGSCQGSWVGSVIRF